MKLIHNPTRNRYEVLSRYEEKDLIKAANFLWDKDAKTWWTKIEENASRLYQAADEPLRSKLEALALQSEKAIEMSKAQDSDMMIPCPEGLQYLPFQKAGIVYMAERRRVLNADTMGLGKTVQAIGLVNLLPELRSILVICPASLKLVWREHLKRWLTRKFSIGISNGDFPETGIVVINYDILKKHIDQILSRKWDLIVADEAHYMKNPKAQRTRLVAKVVESNPEARFIPMTGTPIVNRPIELFSLLRMLDPQTYHDSSFFRYAKRYCDAHQIWAGRKMVWDFSGSSNLEELQEKLRKSYMVRRLKEDVLFDLPPKTRQIVLLDSKGYSIKNEEKYRDVVLNLGAIDTPAFDEMSILRHEMAVSKAPAVAEFVKDLLESEGKVIVFAWHHDVIDILRRELQEFHPVSVVGGMSPEEKDHAVKEFQEGSARIFLGNIQAAGVGLTLTQARVVVFAELSWVPGDITQAEDRAHRIGQLDNVLVYHVVVDGSLDALLAKEIIVKQDVISQAVDNLTKPFIVQIPDEKASNPKASNPASNPKASNPDDIPDYEIDALKKMAQFLAGRDWDHAREKNDVGFNGTDTAFGHVLADAQFWSRKMARIAKKLLKKYHKQLPEELYQIVYKGDKNESVAS